MPPPGGRGGQYEGGAHSGALPWRGRQPGVELVNSTIWAWLPRPLALRTGRDGRGRSEHSSASCQKDDGLNAKHFRVTRWLTAHHEIFMKVNRIGTDLDLRYKIQE